MITFNQCQNCQCLHKMHLIYTFLLIFFINLQTGTCWFNFWHKQCNKNHSLSTNQTEEDEEEFEEIELPEISNHLDEQCCPVAFKTVINPHKMKSDERDALPACVKCAICLAIAENVEKVFASTVDDHKYCSPVTEKHCLETDLKSLCKSGFVNYDLRQLNGLSLITDHYKETQHVRTPMDGSWTQMLRSACNNLLEKLDDFSVYTAYKSSSLNVTNYLCKGFGVFRDCNNIRYDIIQIKDDDYAKVRFWVSCLFN